MIFTNQEYVTFQSNHFLPLIYSHKRDEENEKEKFLDLMKRKKVKLDTYNTLMTRNSNTNYIFNACHFVKVYNVTTKKLALVVVKSLNITKSSLQR